MDAQMLRATAHRMTQIRALLVKENPFFGHLALSLTPACASCGTACTDGTRLIFDPKFAARLSDREMLFVTLHEVLHCALEHCTRGKGLDSQIHNVACDIVVNSMILDMWGLEDFTVAGEPVIHRVPDGGEGRLYHSEEVYYMLLEKRDPGNGLRGYSPLDRHDLWQGISDPGRLTAVWNGRILQAARSCGDISGIPQKVRDITESLLHRSKLDWRQLLHDFLQYDTLDYAFTPPDRRYADGDYFLPSFSVNEEGPTANDLWICVDTSASIDDSTLANVMAEILDAMRQTDIRGKLSFFDTTVTEPVPFFSEEEIRQLVPTGGGGTSFRSIFRYMRESLYPNLPRAILIFTDGHADCPPQEDALGVPVLWLVSKGGRINLPWGTVAVVE